MRAHTDSDLPQPEMSGIVEQHGHFPAYERLDGSMLTLIERVFGQKEFALFAMVLQHAVIKQYSLQGQDSAVAQIRVPSLTDFAQQLGYGKDTLLRHLAVYRCLELMRQRREGHQTILSFPLAPYEPHPETTLPALDLLIRTSRPKLKQLALSVKERYQLAYTTTALSSTAASRTPTSELAMLFLDIQQTLQAKRVTTTKRQLLQQQIAKVLAQLSVTGRLTLDQGDQKITLLRNQETASRQEEDHNIATGHQQENFSAQQGDQEALSLERREDLLHQQGDRALLPTSSQGDLRLQEGDQDAFPLSVRGDSKQQEGDHKTQFQVRRGQNGDFSAQEGDHNSDRQKSISLKEDFPTQEGDFLPQTLPLSINDIGNNTVIYISSERENDTFIDTSTNQEMAERKRETTVCVPEQKTETIQREATALAGLLDKSTDNIGSFITKLKANPIAVRASVIDVLYHEHFPDYRGVPKVRGAWFNSAYKKYRLPHTIIPPEIQRWLRSTASWTDIEEEMVQEEKKARRVIGQAQLSVLILDSTHEVGEDTLPDISDSYSHRVDHPFGDGTSLASNVHEEDGEGQHGDVEEMEHMLVSGEKTESRGEEERKARRNSARRVREHLRESGVVVIGRDGKDGLEVDMEHQCGCPLYRYKGLRRFCAHCAPDLSWSQEVRALIASILDT